MFFSPPHNSPKGGSNSPKRWLPVAKKSSRRRRDGSLIDVSREAGTQHLCVVAHPSYFIVAKLFTRRYLGELDCALLILNNCVLFKVK